jgi:S-adenosylmethionine-diacylglycerol 3-amino-3-carboxypropyl transferase
LCGKVLHEEGLPIEFSEELFNKIKESTTKPIYQQGSIFERSENTKYDFISLSDVPSYLSGEIERNYIQLLAKNIMTDGVIVNRFYLRATENTDITGFKDITPKYQDIISQELVQMYQVQLLQKI